MKLILRYIFLKFSKKNPQDTCKFLGKFPWPQHEEYLFLQNKQIREKFDGIGNKGRKLTKAERGTFIFLQKWVEKSIKSTEFHNISPEG